MMLQKNDPPGGRSRLVRRVALGVAGAIAVIALLAARPWSSRNSFRQMRIFAPGARVENFRTMDTLFPARTIPRSRAPHRFDERPTELPAAFPYGSGSAKTSEFLDRTVTTGLLVLQGNTILAERYFRGAAKESTLTSWSVAKSVTSLLVGVARAEGRMTDLAAPLETWVPEFRGADYGKVRLRDALTMSSGIRFSEEYDDPLSDIHLLFARIFYFRQSAAGYLAGRSAEAAPGSRFHYASADTLAIGLALRNAIGKPLAEYLDEKLWQPLGMEYDANWNVESDGGAELAFCCLNVALRDYAKIGRLVARRGDWDGKRIVPEEWIAESTRIDAARKPGTLPRHSWGYQYQWWIPREGTAMAVGVWGQAIYIDPAKELVIVKTSVDPDFFDHGEETVAFFEAIGKAL